LNDPIVLDSLYSGTVILPDGRNESSLPMPARSFLMDEDFKKVTI